VGFVVDKVALGRFFSEYLGFPCKYIIPPLLHIHLSPPHEVCDCSDQAAHCHNLGPQLGASLLTRHFGWKQKQKVKKTFKAQWFSYVPVLLAASGLALCIYGFCVILSGIRTHDLSVQRIKTYAS
jgi:hypothetical protein